MPIFWFVDHGTVVDVIGGELDKLNACIPANTRHGDKFRRFVPPAATRTAFDTPPSNRDKPLLVDVRYETYIAYIFCEGPYAKRKKLILLAEESVPFRDVE